MGKKVLVVGSGGREHALAWKLSQSPEVEKVYTALGNPGTAEVGENLPIVSNWIHDLVHFALKEGVDLTVVGPDDVLFSGIADEFRKWGLRIFAPTQAAAEIESDKAFAKRLMSRLDIVSPAYSVIFELNRARTLVCNASLPFVVKANGPAQGKGVYICNTRAEALEAVDDILVKQKHGPASNGLVVERFVHGQEVSIHAFCDGTSFSLFPPSRDHKKRLDGDKGSNTGGMGAFAPVTKFQSQMWEADFIVSKMLADMKRKGVPFVGCLYPGLVLAPDGPQVLEFNARFGDPEAQVYMRLLKSDLYQILDACVFGNLDKIPPVEWHSGFAVCVVLVSEGYPESIYKVGYPITGIEQAEEIPGVKVFHAGTELVNGFLRTAGGRVLSVTATGDDLETAIKRVYTAVDYIRFEGMQYRKDIGRSGL